MRTKPLVVVIRTWSRVWKLSTSVAFVKYLRFEPRDGGCLICSFLFIVVDSTPFLELVGKGRLCVEWLCPKPCPPFRRVVEASESLLFFLACPIEELGT